MSHVSHSHKLTPLKQHTRSALSVPSPSPASFCQPYHSSLLLLWPPFPNLPASSRTGFSFSKWSFASGCSLLPLPETLFRPVSNLQGDSLNFLRTLSDTTVSKILPWFYHFNTSNFSMHFTFTYSALYAINRN